MLGRTCISVLKHSTQNLRRAPKSRSVLTSPVIRAPKCARANLTSLASSSSKMTSLNHLPLSKTLHSTFQMRSVPQVALVHTAAETSLDREVFNENQGKLVYKEMEILSSLISTLESIDAPTEDVLELKKSIEQLKDLFLLVIIGEFNSGKSSFLNAMLGHKWLDEGVTPTTAQVNILRNGPEFKIVQQRGMITGLSEQDAHCEVHVPVPWLKQISLVDTPGTNAVVQGHQEITEHFVPRSDMVLFVTSCDRAFTESERSFLERVKQFNKKVVVVLSKIDTLENPEKELPQIVDFVSEQTKRFFGFIPQIFPVSSRLALRAKIAAEKEASTNPDARSKMLENSPDWKNSKFGDLESFILHTLNAKERGKLKLENPLGIAEHYIKKYSKEQESRAKLIREDVLTLERIDNELESFRAEMMAEYSYHEERIDSVLYAMSERARNFLDERLVLTNAIALTKTDALKNDFEKVVVSDATQQIEAYINDMIDWMLNKQAKQWSRVVEYADHRQQISQLSSSSASKEMVGALKSQYTFNRSILINSIGDGAKKVFNTFDRKSEADKMAAEVKAAIFQTAAFEVGVVGLVCAYFQGYFQGYLNPILAQLSRLIPTIDTKSSLEPSLYSTFADYLLLLLESFQGTWMTVALMDITGLVGVGVLAAAGTVLLPYKKRQISSSLTSQIGDIRIKLKATLRNHFDHELQKGINDLKDNVTPYSRLVHSEKMKLEQFSKKLNESSQAVSTIRKEIETAFN